MKIGNGIRMISKQWKIDFLKLAGCCLILGLISQLCAEDSYTLTCLGDIHYDKQELHDLKIMNQFHPSVPYDAGVRNEQGVFSWRNHTLWATSSHGWDPDSTPPNLKMWKKDLPALLNAASESASREHSVYALQLGDMVQGDCGQLALHEKMLSSGLAEITSRFKVPVLPVRGNHDSRGEYGAEAYQKIIYPYIDCVLPNVTRKDGNYFFRIGPDFYFFYDLMNPDFEFLHSAFEKNRNVRYTFFVTHVPILPASKDGLKNIVVDDIEKILPLLASRKAIVLCGHTHLFSYVLWRDHKTDGMISQLTLNSTCRQAEVVRNFKPVNVTKPYKDFFGDPKEYENKTFLRIWSLYSGKLEKIFIAKGAGHAVLRIDDTGVIAEYYNIGSTNPIIYQLR